MSKYITRNVLICVVPSVIVLLSVYWFRKKKKFKINSFPLSTETIVTEENEMKLDSMAEISSETADTLSDASSFTSPESSEKSIRTKKFPLVTLSNDTISGSDMQHNCISSSNHVEAKAQEVDSPRLNTSTVSLQFYSPISASDKPIADAADIDSAASIAKDLISQVEHAVENLSTEYLSEIGDKILQGNMSDVGDRKTGYDEDFLLNVIHKMGMTNENRFNSDGYTFNDVEKLIKAIETDSNDSRSSVLDENSLSYVSDDSESRQPVGMKTKDSLSSVLDENSVLSSLCDELEKSTNCESPCASLKSNVSPDIQEYIDAVKDSPLNCSRAIRNTSIDEAGQWSNVPTLEEPVQETASPEEDFTYNEALQILSVESVDGASLKSMAPDDPAVSPCETLASCDNLSSPDMPSKSCLNHDTLIDSVLEASSPDGEVVQLLGPEGLPVVAAPRIADIDISGQLIALAPLQQQDSCDSSSWSAQGSLSEVISEMKDDSLGSKVHENSSQYTYEFELPQELCGRLIGKHGKHVKSIKDRSHANVYIKRHPFDPQLKIVVVEGICFLFTCMLFSFKKLFKLSFFNIPCVVLSCFLCAIIYCNSVSISLLLMFLQITNYLTGQFYFNLSMIVECCMIFCFKQFKLLLFKIVSCCYGALLTVLGCLFCYSAKHIH